MAVGIGKYLRSKTSTIMRGTYFRGRRGQPMYLFIRGHHSQRIQCKKIKRQVQSRSILEFDAVDAVFSQTLREYLYAVVHSNSQFKLIRFDSLDESIQIDSVSPKIGPLNSNTTWSLYAIAVFNNSVVI